MRKRRQKAGARSVPLLIPRLLLLLDRFATNRDQNFTAMLNISQPTGVPASFTLWKLFNPDFELWKGSMNHWQCGQRKEIGGVWAAYSLDVADARGRAAVLRETRCWAGLELPAQRLIQRLIYIDLSWFRWRLLILVYAAPLANKNNATVTILSCLAMPGVKISRITIASFRRCEQS